MAVTEVFIKESQYYSWTYHLCAIMIGNLSCRSTEAGRPECDRG